MSILDNNQTPLTRPQVIANHLKITTKNTFQMMVNAFNNGAISFWLDSTCSPSEIADALGTDAKEVFQLHYALGQLIASVKPENISQGLSVIGQFTINEDGTVSVINDIPDVTLEVTPEVTPEATPEVTPEVTPEATPEVTPEVTREK